MLKELTKKDWLALLGLPESRIPRFLILRGTRNLKTNYVKHRDYFTDVFEVGSPNGIFEDVLIGSYENKLVGYASVYGDAMASEITHSFGVLGTSIVIQTGCCGALSERILPGDIVCATKAHCGEGAAQYYQREAQDIEASSELFALANSRMNGPVAVHQGAIWTTSALLAEGNEDIQRWSAEGYVAVDMESASTFAVAKYFDMRRLSLLFAFDNPSQGDHILLTDHEKQERRNLGERQMIEAAFSIIRAF
jgi:purine-nucleoside phosphorylase